MVDYEYTDELVVWEAYDDFRRRDWIVYGAYWMMTGVSAQEYVDCVKMVKQKFHENIEDRLASVIGLIEWLGDDSDPLE